MPYIFGKLWHLAIIWPIRKSFQCILQGVRFLLANHTRLSPTSENDSYTETHRIYRNLRSAEWRNNVSSAKIFKSISRLDEESQTLNYEFRLKSNSCWQILSELMFEISEIDSGMLLFKNAFRLRHLRDTRWSNPSKITFYSWFTRFRKFSFV